MTHISKATFNHFTLFLGITLDCPHSENMTIVASSSSQHTDWSSLLWVGYAMLEALQDGLLCDLTNLVKIQLPQKVNSLPQAAIMSPLRFSHQNEVNKSKMYA